MKKSVSMCEFMQHYHPWGTLWGNTPRPWEDGRAGVGAEFPAIWSPAVGGCINSPHIWMLC